MTNTTFKKPELLAPAGSQEVLEAVVEAGADAVYLSGKMFAMRQHARKLNFDEQGLASASEYLHAHQRLMYVTVNNLFTDNELELLPEYLEFLHSIGTDALIVTDLGLLNILQNQTFDIPLFSSVMMHIHDLEGVRQLQALGFQRVVISQNISLEAVRRIREASGVEIEHFIHGDTCVAVNGQCTHSGISCGEHAGRGHCLKSCRWSWDFLSLSDGEVLKTFDEDVFALARKDLSLYKQLPRLIHAGIDSFKIEGRARGPEFLRPIVAAYRSLIDDYCEDPSAYIFNATAFRRIHSSRSRYLSSSWTFSNPGRSSIGYSGKREPRIFSIAIEEKDACLVEEKTFANLAGEFLDSKQDDQLRLPQITVRCNTPAAAKQAIDNGADRIVIGGEVSTGRGQRWTRNELLDTAATAHGNGVQALLATPRMTTEQQIDEYRWLLNDMTHSDFDAIHLHTFGMIALVREITDIPIHADFSFNVFNIPSLKMLQRLGATQATLSPESNFHQAITINRNSTLPVEVLAHGGLPGMLLEHCIIASLIVDSSPDDACPGPCQATQFGLRDKVGQIHPIETDQYCRNHLLMGKDLCTVRHLRAFLLAEFASLRLELQYTDDLQVGQITALYRRALDRFAEDSHQTLVTDEEFFDLQSNSTRAFTLGGYANAYTKIAEADEELPNNLLIRYKNGYQGVSDEMKTQGV